MPEFNESLFLLGALRNSGAIAPLLRGDDSVSLISRFELAGDAMVGCPMIAPQKAWENPTYSKLHACRIFPSMPFTECGAHSVHKSCLVEAPFRSPLYNHEVHYVNCYDFSWIEQLEKDLRFRPAITLVSEGMNVREEFVRNLKATIKEYKDPIGFGAQSYVGLHGLEEGDEVLNVLTFIGLKYAIPIFGSPNDGMAVRYSIISKGSALSTSWMPFLDCAIVLSHDGTKLNEVDGETTLYDYIPIEVILQTMDGAVKSDFEQKKMKFRGKKRIKAKPEPTAPEPVDLADGNWSDGTTYSFTTSTSSTYTTNS